MSKTTKIKTPTPVVERSHTWKIRRNPNGVWEIRPTKIGRNRYGIKDLGWKIAGKYVTKAGKLTKAAQS